MNRNTIEAKRVINGTHGELWLDGEYVAEVTGFQAKIALKKEPVTMCGNMAEKQKVVGWSGTGSIQMNKVYSRMANKLAKILSEGTDARFIIMSKLADPDSYGSERVAIKDVSFDDLTLADWAASTPGKIEAPFTFSDYEFYDMISAE